MNHYLCVVVRSEDASRGGQKLGIRVFGVPAQSIGERQPRVEFGNLMKRTSVGVVERCSALHCATIS
jgi:hypothetical protein